MASATYQEEPTSGMNIRSWLTFYLDNGQIDGLEWVDKENGIWKLPWRYHSQTNWGHQDSYLLQAWALHKKYEYDGGEPTPEQLKSWKSKFRNSLKFKKTGVKEVRRSDTSISNPYIIYRFVSLETDTTAAGNSDSSPDNMRSVSRAGSEGTSASVASTPPAERGATARWDMTPADSNETRSSYDNLMNCRSRSPIRDVTTANVAGYSHETYNNLNDANYSQSQLSQLPTTVDFFTGHAPNITNGIYSSVGQNYFDNVGVTNSNFPIPNTVQTANVNHDDPALACHPTAPGSVGNVPNEVLELELSPTFMKFLDLPSSNSDTVSCSQNNQEISARNSSLHISDNLNSYMQTGASDLPPVSPYIAPDVLELMNQSSTVFMVVKVSYHTTSVLTQAVRGDKFRFCYLSEDWCKERIRSCQKPELYGPYLDAPIVGLPKPKISQEINKAISKVLDLMQRGVFICCRDGDIYATRYCQSRVYYCIPGIPYLTEPQKLEKFKEVKIFDFNGLFNSSRKKPSQSPYVRLSFGVQTPKIAMIRIFDVDIYHRGACQVLLQAVTNNSLEPDGSMSDDFDKILKIEDGLRRDALKSFSY